MGGPARDHRKGGWGGGGHDVHALPRLPVLSLLAWGWYWDSEGVLSPHPIPIQWEHIAPRWTCSSYYPWTRQPSRTLTHKRTAQCGGGGGADSYLVRSCGALEHCSGGWQLCQCCRGPSRYSRPKTVHGSISVDGGMELGVVCLDIVWYNISLAHLWNKRMLHLALDPSGHRWVWWVWCVMNRGLVPGAGCQV